VKPGQTHISPPRSSWGQREAGSEIGVCPHFPDGLGQAWLASIDDLVEVAGDPAAAAALAALREDELKFIDLENSPMFVVVERTVFDRL